MHDYSFKTMIAWVNTLLHNTAYVRHVDRTRTPDIPNSSAFDLCDLDTGGLARRIYETKKLAHSNSIRGRFFFFHRFFRYALCSSWTNTRSRLTIIIFRGNSHDSRCGTANKMLSNKCIAAANLRYIFFFIIFHVDHVQTASRYLRQNYRNF